MRASKPLLFEAFLEVLQKSPNKKTKISQKQKEAQKFVSKVREHFPTELATAQRFDRSGRG